MDGELVELACGSPPVVQTLMLGETEGWPAAPGWGPIGWDPDLENLEGWTEWGPMEPGMWGPPFFNQDDVSRY